MTPQSERQWQEQVMELAALFGWQAWHFHDSRREVRPGVYVGDKDARGWPDLVLVRERVVFVELKAEKGRVTKAQAACLLALGRAGVEVYVWRPSDIGKVKDILRR